MESLFKESNIGQLTIEGEIRQPDLDQIEQFLKSQVESTSK